MTTFTARVEASELASALDRLKPTKCPAVEMRPHAGGITLMSSGVDLSIDTEAVATASGDVVRVSAAPLATWASRVEGTVTAEFADRSVTFNAKRSKLRLGVMPSDDGSSYIWSAERGTEPIDLSPSVWESIKRCAPASSQDDGKAQFKSVNLEDGYVWATDSYRFHVIAEPTLAPLGFIPVPATALGALKVLDLGSVQASRAGRNQLHLSDGRTHVVIVLLATEPFKPAEKLRQLVPHADKRRYRLTVGRKAAAEALDAVASLTTEARIALRFDGQTLTLSAGQDGRDASFEVDASGDPWPGGSGANKAHLSDLLDVLTSDEVTLEWSSSKLPVVVLDGGFTGLLMPVRHDTDGSW